MTHGLIEASDSVGWIVSPRHCTDDSHAIGPRLPDSLGDGRISDPSNGHERYVRRDQLSPHGNSLQSLWIELDRLAVGGKDRSEADVRRLDGECGRQLGKGVRRNTEGDVAFAQNLQPAFLEAFEKVLLADVHPKAPHCGGGPPVIVHPKPYAAGGTLVLAVSDQLFDATGIGLTLDAQLDVRDTVNLAQPLDPFQRIYNGQDAAQNGQRRISTAVGIVAGLRKRSHPGKGRVFDLRIHGEAWIVLRRRRKARVDHRSRTLTQLDGLGDPGRHVCLGDAAGVHHAEGAPRATPLVCRQGSFGTPPCQGRCQCRRQCTPCPVRVGGVVPG